jgi:hypothetical protein
MTDKKKAKRERKHTDPQPQTPKMKNATKQEE